MKPKVLSVGLCPILNSLSLSVLRCQCLVFSRHFLCMYKPKCGACVHLPPATSVRYGVFPWLVFQIAWDSLQATTFTVLY